MIDPRTAPYAALLLRLTLGVSLLLHGLYLKVIVFGLAKTAAVFHDLGFPSLLAYPTAAIEIVAGLAILLGIYTRWAAVAAIPVLIGATLAHLPSGWLFENTGGGFEYPAFWTMALIVQALLGDGALAVSRHGRPLRPAHPAPASA